MDEDSKKGLEKARHFARCASVVGKILEQELPEGMLVAFVAYTPGNPVRSLVVGPDGALEHVRAATNHQAEKGVCIPVDPNAVTVQ